MFSLGRDGKRRGRWRLTSKEAVEFHEELEIHIVAFWSLAMAAPDVMPVQIDTW